MQIQKSAEEQASADFLYNENPAIVAGFKKGYADEKKAIKKSAQNVLVSKAPSGRELARLAVTEGECATEEKWLRYGEI